MLALHRHQTTRLVSGIQLGLVSKRMLASIAATQPQNMIEKIAQRYAVDLAPGQTIRSGDFVTIRPEHVLTHDNTGAVISK